MKTQMPIQIPLFGRVIFIFPQHFPKQKWFLYESLRYAFCIQCPAILELLYIASGAPR